jgi:hypothetical protein
MVVYSSCACLPAGWNRSWPALHPNVGRACVGRRDEAAAVTARPFASRCAVSGLRNREAKRIFSNLMVLREQVQHTRAAVHSCGKARQGKTRQGQGERDREAGMRGAVAGGGGERRGETGGSWEVGRRPGSQASVSTCDSVCADCFGSSAIILSRIETPICRDRPRDVGDRTQPKE